MKKYRQILLTAFLIFSLTAIAEEYSFIVWTKSGEQIDFPVSKKPKVTHSDNDFIISTPTTIVEYSKSDIKKFTLEIKSPGGIENVKSTTSNISQQDNTLILSGFPVGSTVNIFNINGQLLTAGTISDKERFTIDLSILNRGIYIVSTESITYKIIRQ